MKQLEGEAIIELSRDFHPLAKVIVNEVIPPHFQVPKIPHFDGTTNPTLHLKQYRAYMIMTGSNDALCCKFHVGALKVSCWIGLVD